MCRHGCTAAGRQLAVSAAGLWPAAAAAAAAAAGGGKGWDRCADGG